MRNTACFAAVLMFSLSASLLFSYSPAFSYDIKYQPVDWNKYEKDAKLRAVMQYGHRSYITALAISPDGKYFASGSADNTIKLWRLEDGILLRTLEAHKGTINGLAFSPDGRFIASGGNYMDESIIIWNTATGNIEVSISNTDAAIEDLQFTPDGRFLVCAHNSGQKMEERNIRVWDARNGELVRILANNAGDIREIDISPDGKYVASAALNAPNHIHVWKLEDGTLAKELEEGYDSYSCLKFSPDGKLLLGGMTGYSHKGKASSIVLWNWKREKIKYKVPGSMKKVNPGIGDPINSISFSPDGSKFLVGASDSAFHIRERKKASFIKSVRNLTNHWVRAFYTPDEKHVVASSGNDISIYDPDGNKRLRFIRGFTSNIRQGALGAYNYLFPSIKILNTSRKYIAASSKDCVIIWRTDLCKPIFFQLDPWTSSSFQLLQNGSMYVLRNKKNKNIIELHRTRDNRIIRKIKLPKDVTFQSLRYIPKRKMYYRLPARGYFVKRKTIYKQRLRGIRFYSTGMKLIKNLTAFKYSVETIKISPNGRYIACTGKDSHSGKPLLKLINFYNGRVIKKIEVENIYQDTDFSMDSTVLVSGYSWGKHKNGLQFYSTSSGAMIRHMRDLRSIHFSPDKRHFLGRTYDNELGIYDVRTGRKLETIHNLKENTHYGTSFSPDGRIVAVAFGYYTREIGVWSIPNGKKIITLKSREPMRRVMHFLAGGSSLAVLTMGNAVKIFKIKDGSSISLTAINVDNWYMQNNEGKFDCSEEGKHNIRFIKGMQVIDADSIWNEMYSPGLLAHYLKYESIMPPIITPKLIGRVWRINRGAGTVIIATGKARSIPAGTRLKLKAGNRYIMVTVSQVFHTNVVCRCSRASLRNVSKGMFVYK